MFGGLFIAALIGTCYQVIKEVSEPVIPAENWANKEMYYKDMMNGVSVEQRMKNVRNGKYKINEVYPEPHRNKNGKIVVENCTLYREDVKNYGAVQAQKWIKQGRYNLTPEELVKERKRIEEQYDKLYSLL